MYGRAVPSRRISATMEAGLPPRPAKPLPPCVPFLPQDNDAAACDPSASAVVALLNDRLGRLLRSDAPTFWAHLAHDASIANALDTYLQFRRRPHDARLDGDVTNAASAEEHDLARRVFLVHRRVGDGGEPNAPALATRSAIVRHRNLVDPPKVLDLCALYGPDNPRDLERVLARLVETRDAVVARLEVYDSTRGEDSARNQSSTLGDAFADAGAAIAANLEQMADRVVTSAIDESMALSRDATKDALRYFHDVAASLALLARHAPALARRCKGDAAKDERRALSTTKGLSGLSTARPEHLDTASIGKGKAPMSSLSSLTTLGPSTDSDLGFVTCAPESLCDAPNASLGNLRRARRRRRFRGRVCRFVFFVLAHRAVHRRRRERGAGRGVTGTRRASGPGRRRRRRDLSRRGTRRD